MMAKARIAVAAFIAVLASRSVGAQQEAQAQRDTNRWTSIGADIGYTSFNGDIDPWRALSVAISHHATSGTIIGRANVATRFGTTGVQVEADAYPRLGGGRYLYLNAGFSESSIFPGQRFGAEFYTNLPDAWEASIGLRALWFDGSPVTLYTGTLGKYTGNYWLSFRPFVRIKPSGTSASGGLTIRRYGADADNYFGGRISLGRSPTDRITPDAIGRTNSSSFGLQGSTSLAGMTLLTWTGGYDSEDLDAAHTRNSWNVSVGIARRF